MLIYAENIRTEGKVTHYLGTAPTGEFQVVENNVGSPTAPVLFRVNTGALWIHRPLVLYNSLGVESLRIDGFSYGDKTTVSAQGDLFFTLKDPKRIITNVPIRTSYNAGDAVDDNELITLAKLKSTLRDNLPADFRDIRVRNTAVTADVNSALHGNYLLFRGGNSVNDSFANVEFQDLTQKALILRVKRGPNDLPGTGSKLVLSVDGETVNVFHNQMQLNDKRITEVTDPVQPQDAATKAYVDTKVAGLLTTQPFIQAVETMTEPELEVYMPVFPNSTNVYDDLMELKNRVFLYHPSGKCRETTKLREDFEEFKTTDIVSELQQKVARLEADNALEKKVADLESKISILVGKIKSLHP
jgi:hypothetical protein